MQTASNFPQPVSIVQPTTYINNAQSIQQLRVAEAEVDELQATLTQLELDEFAKARSRIAEVDSQKNALHAEVAALENRLAETEIR